MDKIVSVKKYNLAIDIGNTHIVIGVYYGSKIESTWRLNTVKSQTEDEFYSLIKVLLQNQSIATEQIETAAMASVVPRLTTTFLHLIRKYFVCKLINVNPYTELGLRFPMKDPGFIGADLIVNAFSAREKYHKNVIVCDFGTATTLQLIGSDGYFWGTIIAPGLITSSNNLFEKASLLSNIELRSPDSLLGITTKDALLTGIVTGAAVMIDGLIDKIKAEYAHLGEIITVATGGIADLVCEKATGIDLIDKSLTLDGLNLICLNRNLNG